MLTLWKALLGSWASAGHRRKFCFGLAVAIFGSGHVGLSWLVSNPFLAAHLACHVQMLLRRGGRQGLGGEIFGLLRLQTAASIMCLLRYWFKHRFEFCQIRVPRRPRRGTLTFQLVGHEALHRPEGQVAPPWPRGPQNSTRLRSSLKLVANPTNG